MPDDIRALAGALANLGRTLIQLPEALDQIATVDTTLAARQRLLDELNAKVSVAETKLADARLARETLLAAAEKARADAALEAKQIVDNAHTLSTATRAAVKAQCQEMLAKAEDEAKALAAENARVSDGLAFIKRDYAAIEAKYLEAERVIAKAAAIDAVMKG